MIRYKDGIEAKVGDYVDYDDCLSVVEEVIESPKKIASWGLSEPGLLFRNDKYGRVFVDCDTCDWDTIIFIRRADSAEAEDA